MGGTSFNAWFQGLIADQNLLLHSEEKENEEKKSTRHTHSNSMIKTDDDDGGGDKDCIYNDYDVDKNAPEIQWLVLNIYFHLIVS